MTQWIYDTIVAVIQNGAPALANQLVGSLQDLVTDYQKKCKELEDRDNAEIKKDCSEEKEKPSKK